MRIASLLPSATEIVFALGRGDHLVARTHACDYPPEARTVEVVTRDPRDGAVPVGDGNGGRAARDEHTSFELDASRLRGLAPDVVIAQRRCGVCAVPTYRVAQALCAMPADARIVATDPTTLEEVVTSIIDIGLAIDADLEARALVARLRSRLNWIASLVEGLHRPRVAVVEWPDPLVAPGHWVPELVEAAGGTSVFGTSGEVSRSVIMDELAGARPDVVVLAFSGFNLYETQARFRELAALPGWVDAVRHARLFAMDGSALVTRPGPRLVQGIETLAWALHQPHRDLCPTVGRGAKLIEAGWVDLASLPVSAQATA